MADDERAVFAFPMTALQRRFWRTYQAQPSSGALNGAFRFEITGPLDVRIMEAAVNRLVARHEALRATCGERRGEPVLLIAPELQIAARIVDLRDHDPAIATAAMEQGCAKEAAAPFDLRTGPLVRLGLVRMPAGRTIMTLTIHHMVCDGWSIGRLIEELPRVYSEIAEGTPAGLRPLPLQFGDYLAWQDEQRGSPLHETQLAYWSRQLAGCRRLDVPGDRTPGAADEPSSTQSAIVARVLPHAVFAALREGARLRGATVFVTFLSACMLLLRLVTGVEELAIGTPVAGRGASELDDIVGVMINHVLLRVGIRGNPTFLNVEADVNASALEALSHQDVPFEDVVEALGAAGEPVREPAFNVCFVQQRALYSATRLAQEFSGCRLRSLPSRAQGALYDLYFFVISRENEHRVSLEHRAGKYSDAFATRLIDSYVMILTMVAQNPGATLADLDAILRREGLALDVRDGRSISRQNARV